MNSNIVTQTNQPMTVEIQQTTGAVQAPTTSQDTVNVPVSVNTNSFGSY